MDKKFNSSELGNKVVEPNYPVRKTTLKSVVCEDNDNEPMTTKQANALSQDIKRVADMITGLCNVLLKEDGTLVDLCDRAGREKLTKSVKLYTELGAQMMKAIPSSVSAELCDKDRNLMERFYKDRKKYALTLIFSILMTGILMGIALYGIANNRIQSRELDEWYQENRNAIDFGNFIRQESPSIWDYWHSGRWQDDVAVRDSISQTHPTK